MPTIVTTIGSASANSYATIAEADTYFDNRLNVSTWGASSDDDQLRALIMAANTFNQDSFNWLGSRVNSTQRLAFPRQGCPKVDSSAMVFPGAGAFFFSGSYQDYYLTTEIPQPVKDAQCELALYLLANATSIGQTQRRITEWKADDVQIKYEYNGAIQTMPNTVMDYISGLLAGVQIRRG